MLTLFGYKNILTVSRRELDLRDQLANVTIYEDIFQNSITGSISFVDTNNLTANASIVGQEKLKLVLVTPNAKDSSERTMAINFTDTPLHVYKVSSSVNLNDRTKTFSLSFTTISRNCFSCYRYCSGWLRLCFGSRFIQ